jgi:aspartate aminotransferase
MLFPVPSWNNNHYAHLMQAKGVQLPTTAATGFMPTAEMLAPHLPGARLLVLCSPLNPTGTMIGASHLREIASLIVAENKARAARNEKPLILLFDQIYWQLSLGGAKHVTPIELVPEIAPFTVFVDGVSKVFAATGIRVGWGVGPPSIVARMRDVLGHVGAWAPKAEQVATARWLDDVPASDAFVADMRKRVHERLQALYDGFMDMRARGLPVQAIAPQGAIYLSMQIDLIGKNGITTNEDIRKLLLEKAGFAVVPFQSFDLREESGWFRLSVGAVSLDDIHQALPRVEAALRAAIP